MGAPGGFQVPALESDHSTRRATAGKTTLRKNTIPEADRQREEERKREQPYTLYYSWWVCATVAGARSSFRVTGAGVVL